MNQIGTEAISKSKKVRERFSHIYIDWVGIKILYNYAPFFFLLKSRENSNAFAWQESYYSCSEEVYFIHPGEYNSNCFTLSSNFKKTSLSSP